MIEILKKLILKFQTRNYDTKQDLLHNEKFFINNQVSINEIKNTLNEFNINYHDPSISWHFHVFVYLKKIFDKKNIKVENILEIGTHKGKFTNFLSKVYNSAQIYTIDLDDDEIKIEEGIKDKKKDTLDNFF